MRVSVVTIVAIAVAILIGCAGLFPAFIRSFEDGRSAAEAIVADGKNTVVDSTLANVKAELATANALVMALTADTMQGSFVDSIRAITTVSEGVAVTGIDIAFPDTKSAAIVVIGTAPTRDALLSFRTRLQTLFAGTRIDIPINDLAKNSNLGFNLRFTIKLP